MTYENFDDKENSEHLFMNNLYHPFVRFFQNNPRTVRITNANDSSSEQHYTFLYDTQGQVIKRIAEGAGTSIDYEFKEVE
jgi:hypothetical protein